MTTITTQQLLDVEPKMVLELASGIREPVDIAADYGFSAAQWEDLKVLEPFVKLVDAKKAELKASGWTFRLKSAMAAEDIMGDVYLAAKDQGASFHTRLQALTFFSRAAGLDAPRKDEETAGATFNISINLGGGTVIQIGKKPPVTPPKVPEIDVSDAELSTLTDESVDFEDELSYDSTHCFIDNYVPHPLPE